MDSKNPVNGLFLNPIHGAPEWRLRLVVKTDGLVLLGHFANEGISAQQNVSLTRSYFSTKLEMEKCLLFRCLLIAVEELCG
jgi:hypothetical protein